MQRTQAFMIAVLGCATIGMTGCGGGSKSGAAGADGSVPSGGDAGTSTGGTGGVDSRDGTAGSGGAATGGASATGGTTRQGGATGLGGTTGLGGATGGAGTAALGGTTAQGGTTSQGGTTGLGGATELGGMTGPGGTNSAGGAGGQGGTGGSAGPCTADQTQACACTGSAIGTSYCRPSGAGFGACQCVSYGAVLYVSPTGSATADGSAANPLSLDGARQVVRTRIQAGLPAGGIAILLLTGDYERTASFALAAADSGTAAAPVVYRAAPGASVRILGGRSLDPASFVTVPSTSAVYSRLDTSVRGQVMQIDLKALGITDYGTLQRRGFCNSGNKAAMELAFDGVAQQLARWPDPTDNEVPTGLETAAQIQLFGTVTPDVTGTWTKEGTQDGVSAFARQGLVGGKQYHLYRYQWDYSGSHYQAWFITTGTTGYPTDADPWWYLYTQNLGTFDPSAGATGNVLARNPAWINHGYATIAKADSDTLFTYDGDRPSRWVSATDLWLHGFFKYDWADCHTAATLDTATKHLSMATVPGYGIADGQPWYAENLLEELTVPGEYYIDRGTGILYFLPPSTPLAGHRLVVSTLSDPVVSINGAKYLTIDGITLASSRGALITVQLGSDVVLSHLRLLAAGTNAAEISGTHNGISGCEISEPGAGGVVLSGGDRQSLTAGKNYVEYCRIHDFSRFEFMYTPAVSLDGSGQRASHNLIFSSPHSGILYWGNEHLIELNELHHVCQQTSDAGAIYSGRDWGARGNQVQYNYLHDISSVFQGYGVHGIYLDDCLSGILVQGNVLYKITGHGILHGGGRDNVMVNNIIARSGEGIAADSRCVDWLPNGTPNNIPGDSWNLLEKLNNVGYQQEPWLSKYPACAAIPNDWAVVSASGSHWLKPEGCVFERNVGAGNTTFQSGDATTYAAYASIKDNLADASVLFVDEASGNLAISTNSPAMSLPNFAAPPFSDMGVGP